MANLTPGIIPSFSKYIFMDTRTFTRAMLMAVLFFAYSAALVAQEKPKNKAAAMTKKDYMSLLKETSNSISFIENKGQFLPEVKMVGSTNVGSMWVLNDQLFFQSLHKEKEENETVEPGIGEEEEGTMEAHNWAIFMDGMNPGFTISKEKEMPTRRSYFLGKDSKYWASDVASYGEISMNNIYKGIDLRLYSQDNRHLEFDWLVEPGADFSQIKMRFKGQEALSVDEKGNLDVQLEFDHVKFDIPEAYQVIDGQKVAVAIEFSVKDNLATFKTKAKIDNRYALIIDPSLKWGTWFDDGSNGFDQYLYAVDIDGSGNVYCGGTTNEAFTRGYTGAGTVYGFDSTYNDLVSGGTGNGNTGYSDGLIYKISSNGTTLMNITYFGAASPGSGTQTTFDEVYGLSLSPDFSTVYICGRTGNTGTNNLDIPLVNAWDNSRNGTTREGYVAKFNAALTSLQYSSYIGGSGATNDAMYSIQALSSNSYVVGGDVDGAVQVASPNYILNAYDPTYDGGDEMYIAKFTADNNLVFGTYVGGNANDHLNDIAVLSNGAFAFSGRTNGTRASFPGGATGINRASSNGGDNNQDGVIGVIPANGGTFTMLSRIGGNGDDEFNGIAVDAFDTIYISGTTTNNNFPLGAGASAATRFDNSYNAGTDAIIAKLPATGFTGGTDPWMATYFGGQGTDIANTLRLYTPYALTLFGTTTSADGTIANGGFPVQNLVDGGNFYQSTLVGGIDMYWLVLGTNLKTQYYTSYVGGASNDYLGATGVPRGSNQFVNEGDSLIVLGTTTHSSNTNPGNTGFSPAILGPTTGPLKSFQPFTTDADNDDKHIIFKWRIGVLLNFDYSDAPVSYGGPNHVVFNSLKLGSTIDKEDFPLPSYKSDSDDHAGTTPDDEDGIPGNPTQVLVGDTSTTFTQTVNVTNTSGVTAMLMGWIDFNENGTFDNNEVDTALVVPGATSATLRWTGYNATNTFKNAAKDTTYMRIRITTQSSFMVTNPSPTANASNGEVEDYLVIRFHCVNLTAATINTATSTTCGTATGSITITNGNLIPGVQYGVYYTYNGGAPQGPYYFTTNGITGTLVITGLLAGSYTSVQVFHPTNPACGFTIPTTLVVGDAPRASAGPDQVVCQPASTASLGAAPAGGSWSFISGPVTPTVGSSSGAVSGLTTAGAYLFKLTSGGCTDTVKVTVGAKPIVCLIKTDLPCANICQGKIDLSLCNNPAPASFTVLWSNGSTSTNLTGLCAGTYSVTVTDNNGCTGSSSIVIQQQTNFTSTINVTQPDFNQTNGSLDLTLIGGTSPFTYIWSNGATTQDLSNIGPGTYCVTITDGSGRVITDHTTVLSSAGSEAGSIIVDMGILPQTFGNGLKPYGMIYDLVRNFNVPVKWIIASGKQIDPLAVTPRFDTDFVYNSKAYRGGPFVIDVGYLSSAVRTAIAGWQSQGVSLDTITSTVILPVYQTITSFPNAVIDQANEQLVTPYYANASVPTASYRVGLPSDLNTCDDVYALPHADPTWANHNYLRTFNTTVNGYIWVGCHAVSVLEGIFNPGNNTQRMNFLSTTGLQCYNNNQCGTLITESHNNNAGTTPFSYDNTLGSEPIMQIMGDMTPSQANGSEEWYIPLTTGTWRPTTKTAVRTADAAGTSRQGVKLAYGPGYGNSANGMVMYEAGHTADGKGSTANQVAFERAFFNFLLMTGIQKRLTITPTDVPSGFFPGVKDTLTISVTGGSAPYTYAWSGGCGATFGSPTAASTSYTLPANTPANTRCVITCVVHDNCGRINFFSKVITAIPNITPLTYVKATIDSAHCFSQCSGSITGTGSGGTSPYTYNWSTGATTASISNLCAGTYRLTVNDAVGCQFLDTITIAQPAAITATFNVTKPTCAPLANGSVVTTPAGGSPVYTYAWSNGATTKDLSNIAAGTYNLTITDSKGCTQTFSVIVTNQNTFTPTAGSSSPNYCEGQTIQLNSTGGGTYSWSGPAGFTSSLQNPTRASATTAFTGTYTVTVTSPAGCVNTASVNISIITNPPAPTNVNASPNPICTGNNVTLSAVGSSLAWTFPDGPTATGTPVVRNNVTLPMGGTYSVTQTVNGCTSPAGTVVLVVNPTPVITGNSSANPTTCGGTQGTITLTGLSINTTFSVSYSKNNTPLGPFSFTSNGSGFLTITGLTAGSYTNIVVTTPAGCPSAALSGPIVLTDPTTPTTPSPSSNTPVCSGNAINLLVTAVANASYSWTGVNGNNTFSSNQQNPVINGATTAMGGSYCLVVTVANCASNPGCTNVVVNQTPSILSATPNNTTTCGGGNGTIVLGGLVAGQTYAVRYTKGVTNFGPINIVADGSGFVTIIGLTAGSYTNFTVTLLGCTSAPFAGPVVISDPNAPAAPGVSNGGPFCSGTGNTVTLFATGAPTATYSWTGQLGFTSSQQNPTIANATTAMSGQYCATQTVANCVSPSTCTTVTVNPTPIISSTSSTNPTTCSGSDGTVVLNGLTINTAFTVSYLRNGASQGPFSLTSNGAGTITISGLTAAVYTNVNVTLNNCVSANAGPFTLSDPAIPAAPGLSSNSPVCSGNQINLLASGQGTASFSWTGVNGDNSFSSTQQNPQRPNSTTAMGGQYCATQTVANCVSPQACITVVVNQTPTFGIFGSGNPTSCGGNQGTITLSGLNASANYSVSYTKAPGGAQGPFIIGSGAGGQLVISGLTAGTYSGFVVTLISTGCTSAPVAGPVTLTDPATPAAPFVSSNTPVCSGNSILLFATGDPGATFSWVGQLGFTSNQATPVIPNATATMTGNYCATQTVAGCTSLAACTSVQVFQTPAPPTANASPNPICSGNALTLTATGLVGATFNWVFPDGPTPAGTPIIRPAVTAGMAGLYTVTQTVNGCTSTSPGTVTVTLFPTPGVPSASNNGPVCMGHSIQLNTPALTGATYSWTGPNGFTSSSQSPVIINAGASNAGTYSITVAVNGCPSTQPGTTTVVVNNCTPLAVRDVYGSCAVSPITGNILTNDVDPSGDGIQVTLPHVCGPFSGGIVVNSGGTFTYTPPALFNGIDSICYKVCNVNFPTICDTGIAVFDYTCVNLAPVAVDDNFTTPEDVPVTGNVTTNDFDPDGGVLNVNTTPTCNPQHGSVVLAITGVFTYTPNANFNGLDTFCYQVCDTGTPIKCANAIVVINVTPVNDPPVVPDTTITIPEDSTIQVCIPIDDIEVSTQSHNVNICGLPVHGTLTSGPTINNPLLPREVCYTYHPTTNYNGKDSICLIICDNGTPAKCDTTHTYITITPVNDPPVANNDNYTTNEDTPITTTAGTGVRNNDNDNADGNPVTSLTVDTILVDSTDNGALVLHPDGSFTYTPNANFFGIDSFQYSVCDNGTPLPSLCDTATAYITVLPVNDPPVVPDTIINNCEDCGSVTVCIPVTDNDPGQVHYIAAQFCGPNSGFANITLNGPAYNSLCVTYTSNTNFNGNDSICLIVCDNGAPNLCDTTHIRITITPVNDPPVALNDNYTTNEDNPINTTAGTGVRNNDNDNADGNPVTSLTVTTTPVVNVAHGTLVLNGDGSFTYTPNANYVGTDSFQYKVCDSGTPPPSLCDTATAYITIIPVNDPPVVPDTTVTVPEDSIITVCIPITDPENGTQQHIASFCDAPDNGVITSGPIVDNNLNQVCITYRPNANFNGNDSICLTVCDNGIPSLCDNTIIHIIVTPVNDPPVALNDNYTTNEDTPLPVPVGTGVRANDNDNADGNPVTSLTVDPLPTCNPQHGTLVVLVPNGAFLYIPNPGYNGVDSFCYRVCDNGTPLPSLCDTAVAYITINQVNDPPLIPDTIITTCEDCPTHVCIPFSDSDLVDIHTQTLLCSPVNGTITNITISDVTHFVCFDYQGYANINGSDSLCIVVCDNGVPQLCDTTHVHIDITPVNDPPYADTIYVVTYENIPVGVNVASATGDLEGDPLTYTYGGVTPGGGTFYITGNGAIVYVPGPGFVGVDTIPYKVCDLSPYPITSLCDSAAIIVTVLPAGDTLNNHAPVASNDFVTTPLNTSITVNELANDYDPDGDALQVTVVGLPNHGTITVNPDGTVNYTPNTGYFGFDTIHYVICDPVGATQPRPLCDDAYIVISISRDPESFINDAPVAVDDFAVICADASATVHVLTNDYDPNGDNITSCSVVSVFTHGSAINPGFGLFVYTPTSGYSGYDTMVYRICDNGSPSLCDTATVIITVNPTPVITPSNNSLTTCSGDNVNITFTSSVQGTLINWTGSNNTSGTGNINTALVNSGTTNLVVTYTVTGSTTDGCGSPALTIPVTVKPRPAANYIINNTVYCSGQQVVVNLTSNIAGTTFSWSGSNGSSGTGNIITDNPTNTGIIDSTVTYTINSSFNGCSGTPLSVSVLVHPLPVITLQPSSQTICSGTPITVGIGVNVPGASVIWTGSNGNSGNSLTINDSPVNFGVSNLTVTYTVNATANGCAATTKFATVLVHPRVVADAGLDKSVTACAAACVTIGGSPTGLGSGTLVYAWSPNISLNDSTLANPTACNVTANTTYTVVVTDGNNCSATDAVTITIIPSSLVAEAGSGGALCLGTGDSVMLGGFPTAVGGTPAYTYTWAPTTGLNLTNPANPEAFPTGNTMYHLTVTDALGCISVDSTLVSVYPTLTANAGNDTAVCGTFPAQLGGNPTATGGSGQGYTYLWSPSTGVSNVSDANPTATPLTLTTYTVLVMDANGCSATDNVVVTVRPNPTALAGPDKSLVNCAGDSVTLGENPAVSGGTSPFTYSWSPATGFTTAANIPNPVVKGLVASVNYTLSVVDANGCSSSDQVMVNATPSNLQVQAGADKFICYGNSVQLGALPLVLGGTAPYAYAWAGGSLNDSTLSNPVANPTGTTTYTVSVVDGKLCTASDVMVVTVNPQITASAGPDTSVCAGSLVAIGGAPSASGGTPGYTYSWNPTTGLSLPNIPNPSAAPIVLTTYQLVVVDSRGCSSFDEVTVMPRPTPVVDAGSDKILVACAGDTAFMLVNVSSGTSPYKFLWTPASFLSNDTIQNPYVTGLPATTSYQVQATDVYGCTGSDFIVVNVVQSTLQANAGNDGILCVNGGGSITIGGSPTAAGGTSPYVYSWATAAGPISALANPVVSPTATTTYYVTVTDTKGCTSVDSVRVTVNPAPSANAGADSTMCSGFCMTLGTANTASGGHGPYQYLWSPTVGLNANNTPNPLACPLVTTTYNVVVTDSNGCQVSDAVTVTIRPVPVADAGVDKTLVTCAADSTTIGGSPSGHGGVGPYTYAWSPATGLSSTTTPNPVVSGILTSQLYTLVVTDANGCTAEDAVLINVVTSTLVAEAGTNGAFCSGSGSSFALGGNPTATGGTGPYVYDWSPSNTLDLTNPANPVATPTGNTDYFVTVTDSKGCKSVDSVKVSVHPAPTACAGPDTAICFGVSVQLGCGGANSTTATGGTPGYTYLWGPSTGLDNPLASNPTATPGVGTTTYTVRILDSYGCTASDGITVTVHPLPVADAGQDKSLVACSGDSVQIGGSPSASGGTPPYVYDWSPNAGLSDTAASNPYVSHLGSSATYTLVVTGNFGCTASDQVTVQVSNASLVAEAGNNVAFCQGASVSITLGGTPTITGGTAPFTYTWTPSATVSNASVANPVATPTQTTTYTVVVVDGTGCIASDTVRITINPRPVVNAGPADTVCAGACVTLGGTPTASGGTGSYTYTWIPALFFSTSTTIPNPTVCPVSNVTYGVTAIDSLGCSNTATVTIKVNENPVANAGVDKSVVACDLACVTLGGSPTATSGGGGYLYAWSPSTGLNNSGLSNPTACNLSQQQTYGVTVTDVNGCTATDQVLVNVTPSTLVADAGPDKSICAGTTNCIAIGGTTAVSGGTTPYDISWSPVAGICNANNVPNPLVNPTDTTSYVLLVTDAQGCVAVDSMVLYANPAVTASVHPDTAICAGGAALLGNSPTGSGGTPSYTYSWSPGTGLSSTISANPVATPASTTSYCVTVTDAVSCSSSACQTVTVNPAVCADAGPDRSITSCVGAFTTLGGSPTGGCGSNNYSFLWSNGSSQPNPVITGLAAGTYTFTVTVTDNATGCFATDQVVVTVNQTNLAADAGADKVFCANSLSCVAIGGNPTATGGQAPYIYQWSPALGLNNPTFANPCAAAANSQIYTVTVTDALGCFKVDSMLLTVSPLIAVNAGPDTAICTATTIVLGANPVAVGGTAPYTYAWSGGAFPVDVPNPSATPIANSSYTLVVTDKLGCSSSDIVNVTLRPLPTANAGPDVTITSCSMDSAILGGIPAASGTVPPYTYSWFPTTGLNDPTLPNPEVDSLGNNVPYTLTVTDSFGCKATDQVQVTVTPVVLNIEAGVNVGSLCANTLGCVTLGGSPTVTGSGLAPYTYLWTGAGITNPTASNPQACPTGTTTYSVEVTDQNGCRGSDTVRVIVNTPPSAGVSGLNANYCVGAGNVIMTGTPAGGTFSGPGVTGNVFQPSAVGAGFWCIRYTYTDPSTGCSDDTTVCVTVSPLPVVTASGYAPAYCRDEPAVTLVGSPAGGTFTGSPGLSGPNGTTFNPATATIGNNVITYTYTDPQTGCSNTFVFAINVKASPTISITASTDSSCAGATVVFTPVFSPDVFNVIWSLQGGGNIGAGLNPFSWVPTATDYCVIASAVNTPNGCSTRDTVCGHVNALPVVTITGLNNSYCLDAACFTLTGSPAGGTFTGGGVSNGQFCPGTAGVGVHCIRYIYTDPVTGCTGDTTACITVNPLPVVSVSGFNSSYCPYAAPVTVTGSPAGGTFSGPGISSTGVFTPSQANVGNDTLTYSYTDQNSCSNSIKFVITINAPPTISVAVSDDSTCRNQAVTLSPTFSLDVTNIIWTPVGLAGLNPITITPTGVNYCVTAKALSNNGCFDSTIVCIHVNQAPVATPDEANTCEEDTVTVDVLSNDFDADGDSSTITVISALHGTTTVNGGLVTYVPRKDYNGADTLTYLICNVNCPNDCDTGTLTVNICPINDAPVAFDTTASTCRDSSVTVCAVATDVDAGAVLTYTALSCDTMHGTFTDNGGGCITYTPASGYAGTQTICMIVCDNAQACDTSTITITVNPCNTPPVAGGDTVVSLCNKASIDITVLNNDTDADGDTLHVTALIPPVSGTLTQNGDVLTYTAGSATGSVTMGYVVCDDGTPSLCDTGTIVVTVIDCNIQVTDIYDTTCVGTAISECVNSHVTNTNGWTVTNVCAPTNGGVAINSDSCFTYTPIQGFTGTDVFCISICDVNGLCDTALVHITTLDCNIQAVNEPCDLDTTIINRAITVSVLDNDIIPAAADTTVTILTKPVSGTAVVNGNLSVTYTPNTGFVGEDQFDYIVCTSTGTYSFCDTANVCITVIDTVPCYIPNAFSPNGDGVNDLYKIPCSEQDSKATLRIFDRWGVEIWFSKGAYQNDWNGKNMQGTDCPDGTYYIIYEYNDGTGKRACKFVVIQR